MCKVIYKKGFCQNYGSKCGSCLDAADSCHPVQKLQTRGKKDCIHDSYFPHYFCPDENTKTTTNEHSNKHSRSVGADEVYINDPSNTREERCGPGNIG